jgi:hypothetical protein
MKDDMIDVFERATTRHVPMIVSPTSDLWVEFTSQIGRRQVKPASNYSADAVLEGLNILLGRHYEQYPIRVSAHVLSEEVEAACHVRDDCAASNRLRELYTE